MSAISRESQTENVPLNAAPRENLKIFRHLRRRPSNDRFPKESPSLPRSLPLCCPQTYRPIPGTSIATGIWNQLKASHLAPNDAVCKWDGAWAERISPIEPLLSHLPRPLLIIYGLLLQLLRLVRLLLTRKIRSDDSQSISIDDILFPSLIQIKFLKMLVNNSMKFE